MPQFSGTPNSSTTANVDLLSSTHLLVAGDPSKRAAKCKPWPTYCRTLGKPTPSHHNPVNDFQVSLISKLVLSMDDDPVAQADLGEAYTLLTDYLINDIQSSAPAKE